MRPTIPFQHLDFWLHHRRHDAGQVWGSHTRVQICDLRQFVIQFNEAKMSVESKDKLFFILLFLELRFCSIDYW